jgi:23S rRNA (pseudouridine1915-N3)-methyltransferase
VPLRVLAVGTRMPNWVDTAFDDYARRLRDAYRIELTEIPMARRKADSAAASAQAMADEGKRLLAQLSPNDYVVALDERGTQRSSRELARWLSERARAAHALCFLIGGPDGFAPAVLERVQERWSLSALTLPHALVRVLLAEQLYRARCLQQGHPYHRD